MDAASAVVWGVVRDLRPLFYLESPSTSSYQRLSEVPNYLEKVIPYFSVLILLEAIVRWAQGKTWPRLNDTINSVTAGLMMILVKVFTKSIEITAYVWVYSHFCVVELPWDSPLTWWLAFLGVDCGYYWLHRMGHEVNFIWAAHQAHHSSEDYTLATALRQSSVLHIFTWFVYMPLALFLPPPVYLVHQQFNLLYQFWIHTEVIDRLGPLEWVLNTPSHHRVHHGRNPYCIDCNYAGVLIIWDRMFGTFEAERKEEKVVYGLVHPLGTWNPFWAQVHHYVYIWRRLWQMEGLANKLSFLLKGPGWSPGKPRLGCQEDIPQVSPDEKPYDRPVPAWLNVYVVLHFLLVLIVTQKIGDVQNFLHPLLTIALISYLMLSLTNFGLMFDRNPRCVPIEVLRLAALLLADLTLSHYSILSGPVLLLMAFRVLITVSLVTWSVKLVQFHLPQFSLSNHKWPTVANS